MIVSKGYKEEDENHTHTPHRFPLNPEFCAPPCVTLIIRHAIQIQFGAESIFRVLLVPAGV